MMAETTLLNRRLSDIFVLIIALVFFLDAVNIDDICSSHGMIHEEYQGQSTEEDRSFNIETIVAPGLTTTQNTTYRQTNKTKNSIFLIDEDSPSLPAHPTITQEIIKHCSRNVSEELTGTHIQPFNFHSFCKLQI